mgnify:CR=1 FL=1
MGDKKVKKEVSAAVKQAWAVVKFWEIGKRRDSFPQQQRWKMGQLYSLGRRNRIRNLQREK